MLDKIRRLLGVNEIIVSKREDGENSHPPHNQNFGADVP